MIASVIYSILIVIVIVICFVILKRCQDDMFMDFPFLVFASSILIMFFAFLLVISLMLGYCTPSHNYNKETIIYLLENEFSKENIDLAKNYNGEEQLCNNYFFRFNLRNEDLIDIDYYLQKDEVEE